MAIEVPEGVQGLFLVLTGEKWPSANEDALREVGQAWGTAGDRLENEAGPYLVQLVQNVRENFTGKSAIKFAEMMGPYAADPPHYIPQAAQQYQGLKKFLLEAAEQVEYVKLISIEELVLLIAQIAWAIAAAYWTAGASMVWLAGRIAVVRFLLQSWWGRLILQFALAELTGMGFQVALDVLTQAIQFAKGDRTHWDVRSTFSSLEVGAVGGLLALPFSAISHVVSHKLTGLLSKVLGQKIDVTALQPFVVRAVNEAAQKLGHTPISTLTKNATSNATKNVAKDIVDGLFKAADQPLRVRLIQIGVPALIELTEEGLHEVITEGVVMAANGQGFQFNPFSFTSGLAGGAVDKLGHGLGAKLAGPHPPAHGYTRLPDDTNGGDNLADGESLVSSPSGDSRSQDAGSLLADTTSLTEGTESTGAGDTGGSGDEPFTTTPALPTVTPVARITPPLPQLDGTNTVGPADLALLKPGDERLTERILVDHGSGELISPSVAGQAARRLGVDVVARVDRGLIGNGRRPGEQWMVFQANGTRPRSLLSYDTGPTGVPSVTSPTSVTTATAGTPATNATSGMPTSGANTTAGAELASGAKAAPTAGAPADHGPLPPRLPTEIVRQDYPWLAGINPFHAEGGDFATNCMLAAIYTDRTIEERSGPLGEPVRYQVPPSDLSPYDHLYNHRNRYPVPVPGYASIVAAMTAAGPGARGLVVVGETGSDIGHVFNVTHDRNGVVFLDGQRGAQADLPPRPARLEFLSTNNDVPVDVTSSSLPSVARTRYLGQPSDGRMDTAGQEQTAEQVQTPVTSATQIPAQPVTPATSEPAAPDTVPASAEGTRPENAEGAVPETEPSVSEAAPTPEQLDHPFGPPVLPKLVKPHKHTGQDPAPPAPAPAHDGTGGDTAGDEPRPARTQGPRPPRPRGPRRPRTRQVRWADQVTEHDRGAGDRDTAGDGPRPPRKQGPRPPRPRGPRPHGPRTPWYAAHGGLGDGGVTSVPGVDDESAQQWISTVTAGLGPSVAVTVRQRILAVLHEEDPGAWERLLRHGKLIVTNGVRVKLAFSAENLKYEQPSGPPPDPGYQTYFSKYGDTSYSEGESEHVHRAGTGQIEPLLFVAAAAQGALSHVSPSLKIGVDHGKSSGRSIAMEVQAGNRVIANAAHVHEARIRVTATVNREPRPDLLLPGTARLSFPTVYSSPAEADASFPSPGFRAERPDGHSDVRVVDPTVLHELDHAVNAMLPGPLLDGLTRALDGLGVPEGAVDRIRQEVAEEYFNEKTLKDRSQWWLTDSWVSNLVTEEVSRWVPDFRGHVEVSGAPFTVRYVTTTAQDVLIRNDIADTALIRDGGERSGGASITPGLALGFEVGENLATPSFDVPTLKSSRTYGHTVASEGQAKNAIMRKDRLVRYRTEFLMTVRVRSNKGDTEYTAPIVGELAIGREHAREFERQALGSKLTGSGLVTANQLGGGADPARPAPELPPRSPAFAEWLTSRFPGGGPPRPFPSGGVGHPHDLAELAHRRPLEIAVPRSLHHNGLPHQLFRSDSWRELWGYPNIHWTFLDAGHEDESIFVTHDGERTDALWRYVLDGRRQVVGAVLMERQPDGGREARGYVPNPRVPLPAADVQLTPWYEPLDAPLRAAGLDDIADFLGEGGLPQVQLTDGILRSLASMDFGTPLTPLMVAFRRLDSEPRIRLVAADGRPLRIHPDQDRYVPERRFVIDGDVNNIQVHRPHRPYTPWHHVVHPREPLALAARKGLGRGIVRETPGLQNVYREVQSALEHQIRSAGVADRLSANDRQHLSRVLAMKFGVPGLRGAYPALLDGGVSHEVRIGGQIFTVMLDAELRGLRRAPVAEQGVTLDAQHKGVASLTNTEQRGLELGGGFDIHFRARLTKLFSLDLNILRFDAKRAWTHKVIDSTGVKEYRREKTSGPVTRFEYDTVYRLTVTTRSPGRGVTAAQVREMSGDRYWTAVTVSDAHLPKTPLPTEKILSYGDVRVHDGALNDDDVRRFAARPGQQEAAELDLNAKGLSGIRVGIVSTSAVSEQLADMVAEQHGGSWIGAKADTFQQVLANIVPAGRRYGVTERILRTGTQTFLEANTRAMLGKKGLPVPLPPTLDGWRREVRIWLRTFNPVHENAVQGATLEQYSEADLRFGEENTVTDEVDAASGLAGVFRVGPTPAAEGGHITSQKSASQVSGGVTVGGGGSRGRQSGDLGGGLDLNLGTYTGDSEQVGADAVYTLEYRRWRRPRPSPFGRAPAGLVFSTTTRHVRVERGAEILAPYVRASDHGLPKPPGRPATPTKNGGRHYLDQDLGLAVAHVEHVSAEGVLDAIEEILGDQTDPEMLTAVQSAFSEEAIRAQFGIIRKGGIQQVFTSPARLWRRRGFWDSLRIPAQLKGTVHTGIRVRAVNESVAYERPRPDVRVTTGGQAFTQTGKSQSRERFGAFSAFVHGRWAGAPKDYRPAGGINVEYKYSLATKIGVNSTARDVRRATAADSSQEFRHDVEFSVEVFHRYSPHELVRRAWQVVKAGPTLVEVLSRGESRRLWYRVFPPARSTSVTRQVPGQASVVVPTHLTTTTRPEPIPAGPGWALISRLPTPPPSPLAHALAEHAQALSTPGVETLSSWAPAAFIPWRRIDHRAASDGVPPTVAEFGLGTQDGLTLDIALTERNVRANIMQVLTGAYRIPLTDGNHLTVQLVPGEARWLSRGSYTALNFPEHAEEPERETEESRGWSGGVEFDLGRPVGRPLVGDAETPLLDGGAAYDRGTRKVRVKSNATGDYVESNRQRDGAFDYYLLDATWIITGPHDHTVTMPISNGLVVMLPEAVVQRLIADNPDLLPPRPQPSA